MAVRSEKVHEFIFSYERDFDSFPVQEETFLLLEEKVTNLTRTWNSEDGVVEEVDSSAIKKTDGSS